MPFRLIRIITVLVFLIPAFTGYGLEYRNADFGYFLDLPDGWSLLAEDKDGNSSFCDKQANAILQVFSLPGSAYAEAGALFMDMKARLGAAGEGERFDFSGKDAVYAVLTFNPGKVRAKGYFLFVHAERSFVVIAFAPDTVFTAKEDVLLSALNSFSPDRTGESLPGPVSQMLSPLAPGTAERQTVNILGKEVPVQVVPAAYGVSQTLIEREARVLLAGTEDEVGAWKRYYRLVYRDSFFRLQEFGTALAAVIEEKGVSDEHIPQEVLTWLQGFSYVRPGLVSDLLSPLEAVRLSTGDCDSRALLYVILLRYLSYDSTMFISKKFAHSLGGVATAGSGARLEADGRSYLVAELTANVRLGLIDRTMADPAEWFAVPLPLPEGM